MNDTKQIQRNKYSVIFLKKYSSPSFLNRFSNPYPFFLSIEQKKLNNDDTHF